LKILCAIVEEGDVRFVPEAEVNLGFLNVC